jgi:hypothetical protein
MGLKLLKVVPVLVPSYSSETGLGMQLFTAVKQQQLQS